MVACAPAQSPAPAPASTTQGSGATAGAAGDRTVLPLPTPQLDKLAKQGVRYNNFHTEPGAPGLNAGT